MSEWLHTAIGDGISRLEAHADEVGLGNIDEFTFRAFLMATIKALKPEALLQREWYKYDLLSQVDGENHLIELKCFVLRRTIGLDGKPGNRKGTAGPKNEAEFWKDIKKLHECEHTPIHARHMVICYQREPSPNSRYSFEQSYAAIEPDEKIERVVNFKGRRFQGRWFVIR
jgi:hypothetical protein